MFVIIFLEKVTFFMLGTWYCIRCFLSFFLGKNVFSHPLQVHVHNFSQVLSFMTFSTISSSKMFHHFFQTFLTFFTCYSTRWLLNLLEKKMFSRIHCNFLFITFLNGLPHSSHVIAQDGCWIYSRKKCFLAFTVTSCSSLWFTTLYACYSTRCLLNLLENKRFLHSMHVIALYVCWISFSEKRCFFTCTAISCSSIFLHCFYCVNHNFIFYMVHHFLS